MTRYKNAFLLLDREDGEVIVKAYEEYEDNMMMRDVSKYICFSDCYDTFEVISIIYHGREIEYGGWRPGMLMQYYFKVTGDLAWEQSFPQWDHQSQKDISHFITWEGNEPIDPRKLWYMMVQKGDRKQSHPDADCLKSGKPAWYLYHWKNDPIQWDYICSCCDEHSEYKTKFCPNCGAKMHIEEGKNGT